MGVGKTLCTPRIGCARMPVAAVCSTLAQQRMVFVAHHCAACHRLGASISRLYALRQRSPRSAALRPSSTFKPWVMPRGPTPRWSASWKISSVRCNDGSPRARNARAMSLVSMTPSSSGDSALVRTRRRACTPAPANRHTRRHRLFLRRDRMFDIPVRRAAQDVAGNMSGLLNRRGDPHRATRSAQSLQFSGPIALNAGVLAMSFGLVPGMSCGTGMPLLR